MDGMASCCVFEYMYRDAGNWKTYGALLLLGNAQGVSETLRECLEWDDLFVAEQVGVPPLCEQHFIDCGETGPSELDHAYHEFVELRPATDEDISSMPLSGELDALMVRFRAAAGRWDVRLSPNCEL